MTKLTRLCLLLGGALAVAVGVEAVLTGSWASLASLTGTSARVSGGLLVLAGVFLLGRGLSRAPDIGREE